MKFASALLAVTLAAAFAAPSQAAEFPSRPVTLLIPAEAGGPTDTLARVLAGPMGAALGQPVLVEIASGAAGAIAAQRVAEAAPDGHTALLGHWGTHVLNPLVRRQPYDAVADFAPVAMLASNPQIIVSRADVPARDLRALVEWLRSKDPPASIGHTGVGSGSHLSAVHFREAAASPLLMVAYRGSAPALRDLLGGRIDLKFEQPSVALPLIREGRIRAYAVTSAERLAQAPAIPTTDEAGLPGFHVSFWYGLWAPRSTPEAAVARLQAAAVAALADPATRRRLADLGQEVAPRNRQSPEGLRAWQRAEMEKWRPIVRSAGIPGESR